MRTQPRAILVIFALLAHLTFHRDMLRECCWLSRDQASLSTQDQCISRHSKHHLDAWQQ